MSEQNNRKVLISVKVSTLLLILLITIIVVVSAVVFLNKKSNDSEVPSEQANVNNNINNTSNDVIQARATYTNVTSRSLAKPRNSDEHHLIAETENSQEETEVAEEIKTTPIEEVTISKDMDLTVRTGLSREDFITLMSGVEQDTTNFFEENAGLIYDMCEKYQLNEIFFCGLISAEAGWTISTAHRNTYNYISLMSSNGLIRYSSVEDGIEKAAQTLHDKYLSEGGCFYYGSTLAGMKTRFCPASSTWVNLVYQRMEQILN